MKVQYASDLHMEFPKNLDYIESHPFQAVGDVLVLAGDIFYLSEQYFTNHPFWDFCASNFKQTLIIPGNHEYYGHYNLLARGSSWHWMFRDNVGYYQNEVVRVEDTDFILTTMWSHINKENLYYIWSGMNDFYQILYGTNKYNPYDFNAEHDVALKFIKASVAGSTAKHIVVVTHHVPTLQCVAPEHRGSILSNAFCVDLTSWLEAPEGRKPDLWVYGHSHLNIDATVGTTRVVCNQLGYVGGTHEGIGLGGGTDFRPDACVTL